VGHLTHYHQTQRPLPGVQPIPIMNENTHEMELQRRLHDAHESADRSRQTIDELRALLIEWFQEATQNYRPETRQLHHKTGTLIKPPGWVEAK